LQAALASAASFSVGAALPLLIAALTSQGLVIELVAGGSLMFLALLGAIAARVGGASIAVGATRVAFWGALAMGITTGVGSLVGATA
jgi:vacuolar iron transporter family protein